MHSPNFLFLCFFALFFSWQSQQRSHCKCFLVLILYTVQWEFSGCTFSLFGSRALSRNVRGFQYSLFNARKPHPPIALHVKYQYVRGSLFQFSFNFRFFFFCRCIFPLKNTKFCTLRRCTVCNCTMYDSINLYKTEIKIIIHVTYTSILKVSWIMYDIYQSLYLKSPLIYR